VLKKAVVPSTVELRGREHWVRCKNCARLKLGSSLPYCEWQGAFLSPDLLTQAWQCEGYKKKEVEKP
jgi:hypothetical protein